MTTRNISETDIDFCAHEMRISYAALLRLAEIACYRSRCDAEDAMREMQEAMAYENNKSGVKYHAASLALMRAASDSALAGRCAAGFTSLLKGDRTELVIVETKQTN